MPRIDNAEIKKEVNFAATAAAGVDNNSIFMDVADDKIKIKDNAGASAPIDSSYSGDVAEFYLPETIIVSGTTTGLPASNRIVDSGADFSTVNAGDWVYLYEWYYGAYGAAASGWHLCLNADLTTPTSKGLFINGVSVYTVAGLGTCYAYVKVFYTNGTTWQSETRSGPDTGWWLNCGGIASDYPVYKVEFWCSATGGFGSNQTYFTINIHDMFEVKTKNSSTDLEIHTSLLNLTGYKYNILEPSTLPDGCILNDGRAVSTVGSPFFGKITPRDKTPKVCADGYLAKMLRV